MRTKRDRRLTPKGTSLALGSQSSIDKMFDSWLSDAAPPDSVGYCDTTSVKTDNTISVLPSVLNGEGTSARVIPKKKNKSRARTRNNYRVPVLNPDGTPAMPTTNRRANKWLKEGKAKKVRNKLGIFQIQLIKEPSGRKKQDIVLTNDPGSAFTGIGVISKKAILYGCTLELPGYKAGSKPNIEKNKFGKKIEKYPNTIVDGMTKRRQLRRSRRYRKTRHRPSRWLNRSKSKIPPSILARKRLELKVITELSNIYPISMIGFEDIKFNHFKDKKGVKGQFFSHVEVGKNWILKEMKNIAPVKIIRGYETNIRRQQLNLKKEGDKTVRSVDSHVNDCIAMGSIMLGLGIEIGNKFKYDTITRPKYSRRFLHLEQFSKGGVRRKYGGSTANWTNIRKGDYVEIIRGKKAFRGWVSGFIDDKRIISVSDFDWKRIGQFSEDGIRLLHRNHGILIMSKNVVMTKEQSFDQISGTIQLGIDNAW
jgi:hypothetical protein